MSAQRSVAAPASSAFSAVGRSRIIPSARRRAGSAPRRVVTARSVSPKTTGISYAVPGYARGASGPLRAMAAERESLASDRTARAPRTQEEKSGSVIGCSLDGGDEGSRPMVGNSIVKGFRFQEESEGTEESEGRGIGRTPPAGKGAVRDGARFFVLVPTEMFIDCSFCLAIRSPRPCNSPGILAVWAWHADCAYNPPSAPIIVRRDS